MATNPMAAMALQQLMGGLSQGQDSMPDRGAQAAQQLQSQLGQLRGANPQMVLEQLQQMYQLTAQLIPHTAQSIPGVAQYLAANLRGLRGAIEAAGKAMSAQSVAGGPLQMSAAPTGGGGQ